MFEGGESLLDGQASQPQTEDESKVEISNNCPPHQPPAFIVTLNACGDPERGRVRPWDALELVPPPVDHQRDVKAEHEGDRDLQKSVSPTEFY